MAAEVPAVSAAIRILEALASRWPDGMTPGALVEALEINRSTCYNIIGTLEQAGWVVHRRNRPGWTLGPGLLLITGVNDHVRDVIAQEEIEALSAELGFVVFVAGREPGGGYRVVAVAERRSGVRVTASVGDSFPFSAPAIMQAFLAWSGEDEVRRLVAEHGLIAFTDTTPTDVDTLLDELSQVRSLGYSKSLGYYEVGQGGVAAPIFDANGHVREVVCSLAFSSQLGTGNVDEVGTAVRLCADAITARTGGMPPAAGPGLSPHPEGGRRGTLRSR